MTPDQDTLLAEKEIWESLDRTRRNAREDRQVLKQQGIWLLLATLGCLGVQHQFLQYAAFVVVVFILIDQTRDKSKLKEPISKKIESISNEIEQRIPAGEAKKKLCSKLSELESETGSYKDYMFIICFGFYFLSFFFGTPLGILCLKSLGLLPIIV